MHTDLCKSTGTDLYWDHLTSVWINQGDLTELCDEFPHHWCTSHLILPGYLIIGLSLYTNNTGLQLSLQHNKGNHND